MSKSKLQLVPDRRKTLISELFPEEEARILNLADIALHNATEPHTPLRAGSRAKADHRKLMDEVQREVEKVRNRKRAA